MKSVSDVEIISFVSRLSAGVDDDGGGVPPIKPMISNNITQVEMINVILTSPNCASALIINPR